jgi:hypothetical protein
MPVLKQSDVEAPESQSSPAIRQSAESRNQRSPSNKTTTTYHRKTFFKKFSVSLSKTFFDSNSFGVANYFLNTKIAGNGFEPLIYWL